MVKLFVYTDGGARGNPGPAAIGILILNEQEKKIAEHSELIGKTTNNQAEYNALIKALEMCTKKKATEIECYSDSELMIKHMKGEYKVKEEKLKTLFEKAKQLEKNFEKVSYKHVKRGNHNIQIVDAMLNLELDRAEKNKSKQLS